MPRRAGVLACQALLKSGLGLIRRPIKPLEVGSTVELRIPRLRKAMGMGGPFKAVSRR